MADTPLLRFPRPQIAPNSKPPRDVTSILSLDGGGLRGIIEACILDELELTIKTVAVERRLRPVGGEPIPSNVEGFDVNVSDYFSVVAGTSTGALLAGYLAQNGDQAQKLLEDPAVKQAAQTAAKIKAEVMGGPVGSYPPVLRQGAAATALAVYLGKGPVIFPAPSKDELRKDLNSWVKDVLLPKLSWWKKAIVGQLLGGIPDALILKTAQLITAKYPSTGIDQVCEGIFGPKTLLSQSRPGISLLVATYDVSKNRPMVFYYDDSTRGAGFGAIRRTLQVDLSTQGADPPEGTYSADLVRVPRDFLLWQAVRASTAAPTYFPTMAVKAVGPGPPIGPFQLADGAVVANNPSLVAMTFALSSYTPDLRNIALLSLGCGSSVQPYQVPVNAGLVGWGTNLLSVLMSGSSELTDALARQMGSSLLGGECPPTYYDKEATVDSTTQDFRKHFRRIQLTANTAKDVSSNKEVKVLSFNGRYVELSSFLGNVKLDSPDILQLLSRLDDPNDSEDLIRLGYLLAKQPSTRGILREFAEEFLLAEGASATAASARKA